MKERNFEGGKERYIERERESKKIKEKISDWEKPWLAATDKGNSLRNSIQKVQVKSLQVCTWNLIKYITDQNIGTST